jgi:hypothetical protein
MSLAIDRRPEHQPNDRPGGAPDRAIAFVAAIHRRIVDELARRRATWPAAPLSHTEGIAMNKIIPVTTAALTALCGVGANAQIDPESYTVYRRVVLGHLDATLPPRQEPVQPRLAPGPYARYLIANGHRMDMALETAAQIGESTTYVQNTPAPRLALTPYELYLRVVLGHINPDYEPPTNAQAFATRPAR